jgi:hypothetical protein
MRSSESGDGLANRREDQDQELPRVPYIEGDITTVPGLSVEAMIAQTDATVVAQLANYTTYSLNNATCKGGFEINTRDGQVRVRWEGTACQEIQGSSAGAF